MTKLLRLCSAALLLGAAGCGHRGAPSVQGYVEAEYVYPASPFAGQLLERPVARGQSVHAGELLAGLNATEESLQVAQLNERLTQSSARLADSRKGQRAEELAALEARVQQLTAATELSRLEADRRHTLLNSAVIAQSEWDQARLALEQNQNQLVEARSRLEAARLGARDDLVTAAEADWRAASNQLAEAQWRFSQKRVMSPCDGTIHDTLFEVGDWVPAGRPVAVVLPPNRLKVRFYVSATDAESLHVGAIAHVRTRDGGPQIDAAVSFISDRPEYTPPVIYSRDRREKLVFLIEARLPAAADASVHPGQPVEIQFDATANRRE